MNELFNENGCLSEYALKSLVDESPELTELNRLEISEHLSFCDACLDRYMLILQSAALKAPPKPQTPAVKKRIAARGARLFINRYITVAAAACFALIFTVFGALGPFSAKPKRTLTSFGAEIVTVNETKQNIVKATQDSLQSIWELLNPDSDDDEGDSDND